MPLLDFWSSNPSSVAQLTIEQVVAMAGDGNLKDASPCSLELREYLSQAHSEKLAGYLNHCLTSSFAKGGMVLQDLVNELGRRLDYKVTNGRYQGVTNAIGYDGIWLSPEGHHIVAEVKTTDAYRISLDTIGRYRDKLIETGQISPPTSILIIVGRDDTGELEAQVRGSRHAWDIRLISADALLKLVKLKESADGQDTGVKIRSLLIPKEYTRLDAMIDVIFTTATDVEQSNQVVEPEPSAAEQNGAPETSKTKGVWEFTDSKLLEVKRNSLVAALCTLTKSSLIRKSVSLHWSADHSIRVACTISKRYTRGAYHYWYAYHPSWDDFLSEGEQGYFVLGCMDIDDAFAIPFQTIHQSRSALNTTTTNDGKSYWHIHLTERSDGVSLMLPKQSGLLNLEAYRVKLSP